MILVTGAFGVLGRALSEEIGAEGDEVCLLSRGMLDMRDETKVVAFVKELKPRLIFHLAARVHGLMGNQTFPAEMYFDNIRMNTNIVEAARQSGCRKIIAASTVAIYAQKDGAISEASVWDGPPYFAEAPYGHAKRAMLAQLEAYERQYGLQYAYPILTNIYGRHDRFDPVHGHVIPSLICKFHEASLSGAPVEVWGTGTAQRDFISAKDAAKALMLIARQHNGPINVATGSTVRIRTVVGTLQAHSGVREVIWNSSKPDGQRKPEYDVSKLAALGFRPAVGLADGVRDTFDWYAENYPDVRT